MKGKQLSKAGYEQELSSVKAFVAMQNKADGSSNASSERVCVRVCVCVCVVPSIHPSFLPSIPSVPFYRKKISNRLTL